MRHRQGCVVTGCHCGQDNYIQASPNAYRHAQAGADTLHAARKRMLEVAGPAETDSVLHLLEEAMRVFFRESGAAAVATSLNYHGLDADCRAAAERYLPKVIESARDRSLCSHCFKGYLVCAWQQWLVRVGHLSTAEVVAGIQDKNFTVPGLVQRCAQCYPQSHSSRAQLISTPFSSSNRNSNRRPTLAPPREAPASSQGMRYPDSACISPSRGCISFAPRTPDRSAQPPQDPASSSLARGTKGGLGFTNKHGYWSYVSQQRPARKATLLADAAERGI